MEQVMLADKSRMDDLMPRASIEPGAERLSVHLDLRQDSVIVSRVCSQHLQAKTSRLRLSTDSSPTVTLTPDAFKGGQESSTMLTPRFTCQRKSRDLEQGASPTISQGCQRTSTVALASFDNLYNFWNIPSAS